MTEVKQVIKVLEAAVREPSLLEDSISRLQQFVWTSPTLPAGVEEELRALAHDMDFFEPDPTRRREDPSYIDHDCALAEIRRVLAKLKEASPGEE